jgi:Uma2 family endonuclease
MSATMSDWITRHRITVDEYHRMYEVGILPPDARVELIEGEIIDMAPRGMDHGSIVLQLTHRLVRTVGDLALVLPQSGVRLSDISEPQPDFTLLRPPIRTYRKKVPAAGDALLVIEVSDSNLRYDLKVKTRLYAKHGIPEYWVIDVNAKQLRFFRMPNKGQYSDIGSTALSGLHVPVALPDLQIDLTDLLDE